MTDAHSARARSRALAVLAAALVLSMTTWFSATAVIPQLDEQWGLSDNAKAWLTIAVQLGFVAGALVSAVLNLADVVPPRRVIVGGALGAAAANAAILAVDGPEIAIPLRFLTGFFLAGIYPPALKLMSTWYRIGRGTALGILVGALTLGSAVPHLVNGLGGLDWELVVAVTSVLTVAGGLLAATVPDGPYPFPRATFDPHQARLVFSNRGVRLASFGYFGHMWELYAVWAWFFVFAAAEIFSDVAEAAYLTFAVIGIGALGCWAGGVAGDRWGRARTNAVLMAISGVCAVVIGLSAAGPVWIPVLIGLVWGFTVVGDSAQFSTVVTEVGDQAYVATALTLQLALGFTLTVITIWLVPIWVDWLTWKWAFAFLAIGPALGVLSMVRLRESGISG